SAAGGFLDECVDPGPVDPQVVPVTSLFQQIEPDLDALFAVADRTGGRTAQLLVLLIKHWTDKVSGIASRRLIPSEPLVRAAEDGQANLARLLRVGECLPELLIAIVL